MIAAPAIDLRAGRCVQLVGGNPEEERVSLPDPVAIAQKWYDIGFGSLHIIDLSAALGAGDNLSVVKKLVRATPAETQVGGGIRDDARAAALLDAGVDRIIVGTRALDHPEWLEDLAYRYPTRVMVALDTRHGQILRKGWTEETALRITDYLPKLESLPLAGVLSTDVGREGRLEGIDRTACSQIIMSSKQPVWTSGGITTTEELEYLETTGAAGVVLGMAVYTESLNPREVAARWGGGTNTMSDG